jgi:hypothetical protein
MSRDDILKLRILSSAEDPLTSAGCIRRSAAISHLEHTFRTIGDE